MLVPIAEHPYYNIERKLTREGPTTVSHNRSIFLYSTRIVTHSREFLLHQVYDMSYRRLGLEEGILYLHTNQGVYPYQVQNDPIKFMDAFKELIKGT